MCDDNKIVNNPYVLSHTLEVLVDNDGQQLPAKIVDIENNWIVVQFLDKSSSNNQELHIFKDHHRFRKLSSNLKKTQEEIDAEEEMFGMIREVKIKNLDLVRVTADGNCLYRCFAIEVYNETDMYTRVTRECCEYMISNKQFFKEYIINFEMLTKERRKDSYWGSYVDIIALSELLLWFMYMNMREIRENYLCVM